MPKSHSKHTLYVSADLPASPDWESLKRAFNEFGFWLEPATLPLQLSHGVCALFSESDLQAATGKKSYKGWVGREIALNGVRYVMFPPFDTENLDKWEKCVQLLRAADMKAFNIKIIGSMKEMFLAIEHLRSMPYVVFDFETKFLDPFQSGAKILTVAAGNRECAYVIPIRHKDAPEFARDKIIEVIYNCKHLIAHNAKFELRWLMSLGYPTRKIDFDPMVVDHLLDENNLHDLESLAFRHTQYGGYKSQFEMKLKDKKDFETAPLEDLCVYNGRDVIVTDLVMQKMRNLLEQEPEIKHMWETVNRPIISLLAELEHYGFELDSRELDRLIDWYTKLKGRQIDLMRKYGPLKSYFAARPDFNFNSHPQKVNLFYDALKFPVKRRTDPTAKSPDGNPSTDKEAIKEMKLSGKHKPLLDAFSLVMKSDTMLKSFLNVFKMKMLESVDHKLHTNYNQHIVETFRLSSSSPNMQNPPRSEDLRALSLEPIKSVFVSRFNRGEMLQADLSQIELRIAAMYTKDPALVRAYEENRDLHGEMAARVYGKDYTKEQRYKAKRTNFSAVFDIGPEALADMIDSNVNEAKKLLHEFRVIHPVLFGVFDEWWEKAKYQGYIENFCGRKRHIGAELNNAYEQWQIDAVRRSVWNFPIQSSAADTILTGLLILRRYFAAQRLNSLIIGTIHDSVIIDVHPGELKRVGTIVRNAFEIDVPELYQWIDIPIKIDISHGPNLDAQEEWQ